MSTTLHSDAGQIGQFVSALFRYADSGTFVSLRGFDQFRRDVPPAIIRSVKINGHLDGVAAAASDAATAAANSISPVVFAPPIATFNNPNRARTEDLANGLTLSVEIDDGDTAAARHRLEGLLGPVTLAVASGGEWADPATGELHPKLHLHWRLSEPTREEQEHALLRHARDMAARLVGADPTGKPVVHPLRWPGSWNQKATPRLALIVAHSDVAEIHLQEAADKLDEAVEAAGLVAAEMPRSGTPEAPIPLVRSAMEVLSNPDLHYDDWIRLGYACFRATGGDPDGLDIWESWSKKSAKFDAGETEAAWKRIGNAITGSKAPRTAGAGTIFYLAHQEGWQRPQVIGVESSLNLPPDDSDAIDSLAFVETEKPARLKPNKKEKPRQKLNFIDPRTLAGLPVPERKWIVEDWLPIGCVTLNYGDGGTGKTLLAQQLMTACATGKAWCGLRVHQCFAMGFFCEDDDAELHRRQDKINDALGLTFDDLADMTWASAIGQDNLLITYDMDGRGQSTGRMLDLEEDVAALGAKLLVIDTGADTFGGNENDRRHVRQFIGMLNSLAHRAQIAVLLNVHPSRSGMSVTGDLDGGSTAWSNTARSRWSLARPKAEDGQPDDPDLRVLTKRKANYARIGDEIRLRWERGALVTMTPAGASTGGAFAQVNDDRCAEDTFMTLLDRCAEQGVYLSHSKNAGNYAPKIFAQRPDRAGHTKKVFEAAMNRLFTDRKIKAEGYKAENRKWRERISRVVDEDDIETPDEPASGCL